MSSWPSLKASSLSNNGLDINYMIVAGKTVKLALHDDTVEVNLLDQVDKWVGYYKGCIRPAACNLYFRGNAA